MHSAIQLMVNGFYTYQLFFTALFYLPIQLFCILLEVIVSSYQKQTSKNAKLKNSFNNNYEMYIYIVNYYLYLLYITTNFKTKQA